MRSLTFKKWARRAIPSLCTTLALEDCGNLHLGVTYLSHVLCKENDFHMSPLLHSQNICAQVGRMLPTGCIPLVSSHG